MSRLKSFETFKNEGLELSQDSLKSISAGLVDPDSEQVKYVDTTYPTSDCQRWARKDRLGYYDDWNIVLV